jgi:hypothetical protein
MSKYITLFDTHTDYQTYINGQDKLLPNVSYCEDNNDVHYNPFVPETRIIAKFNVTSTSSATSIMNSSVTSQFSEIEIDGIVQPSVVSNYTFDTTGEHTVKYTLVDPTTVSYMSFYMNYNIKSVIIPNNITSINASAFGNCAELTDVVLGSGLTNINTAFRDCYNLSSIISLATTAPTIQSDTFQDIKTGGTLTVPSGSTGYDVWMGTDDYYLGKYSWTKVEQ